MRTTTWNVPMRKDIHLTNQQAGELLSHWLGKKIACREVRQLEGGICSAVFLLEFDQAPCSAVVKLQDNPEDDPLPRERERLDYLHEHTNVPCPRVYLQDCSGTVIPYSFLLLERLPGVNLRRAQLGPEERAAVERELAEALLDLHSHKRETFGEFGDEPGVRDWRDYFMPYLDEARSDMDEFLAPEVLTQIDDALVFARDALSDQGEPTLVHNDVWAGNIMVHQRSDGWHLSGLLDPVGLQYADVESELAYLQAFDTVGETFFGVYSSQRSLRPGYEFRRLFYWLHTYMTHVWLRSGAEFGDRVAETSRRVVETAPMFIPTAP